MSRASGPQHCRSCCRLTTTAPGATCIRLLRARRANRMRRDTAWCRGYKFPHGTGPGICRRPPPVPSPVCARANSRLVARDRIVWRNHKSPTDGCRVRGLAHGAGDFPVTGWREPAWSRYVVLSFRRRHLPDASRRRLQRLCEQHRDRSGGLPALQGRLHLHALRNIHRRLRHDVRRRRTLHRRGPGRRDSQGRPGLPGVAQRIPGEAERRRSLRADPRQVVRVDRLVQSLPVGSVGRSAVDGKPDCASPDGLDRLCGGRIDRQRRSSDRRSSRCSTVISTTTARRS